MRIVRKTENAGKEKSYDGQIRLDKAKVRKGAVSCSDSALAASCREVSRQKEP